MEGLSKILEFIRLTHNFQKVQRVLFVTGEDRKENDWEHSFQLTLLAWYMIDSQKMDLDISKAIRYALIHDLVEVYAGDTYVYTKDEERKASKKSREKESADRIEKEFPEFADLHKTIKDYEERGDRESRFVYALDKVIPVLNIYSDKGRTWKALGITLDMLIEHKTDKVALSPEVKKYFDELISLLRSKEKELFH